MRLLRKIAIGALLSAASVAGAQAADAFAVPVTTAEEIPVAGDTGFDWNGFYAGIYGVGQLSPSRGTQFGAGVNAGVNAQ